MNSQTQPPVILTDADNTLWDTDAVYASAQLAMLDEIERIAGTSAPTNDRLAWLREIDQAIASVHHRGLRYPPSLLAHALALAVEGSKAVDAAALAEQPRARLLQDDQGSAIADRFVTAIRMLPPLLPGVRTGLDIARTSGVDVWVLTEAHADLQRARIASLGLEHLVAGVSEVSKTIEQYGRQVRRFAPHPVYVFGDQPDRDIIPAAAAGCRTALIPSRFKPFWFQKETSADYVATSFAEAMTWALKTEKLPS